MDSALMRARRSVASAPFAFLVDLSLTDVFEEEIRVDERLKYLADTQDDVAAQDLAGELREFLAELDK